MYACVRIYVFTYIYIYAHVFIWWLPTNNTVAHVKDSDARVAASFCPRV